MLQKTIHIITILAFLTSSAQSFIFGDKVSNYTDTLSERYNTYYTLKDTKNHVVVNAMQHGDITCNFSMEELSIRYEHSRQKLVLNDGILKPKSILLFHQLDSIYKMPDHPKCSYYFAQLSGSALISKVIAHENKYLILSGTFTTRWHTYKNIYIIDCSQRKLKLLKKVAFRTLNSINNPIVSICFKPDFANRKLYIDSIQNGVDKGVVVEKGISNEYRLSPQKEISNLKISDFTIFIDRQAQFATMSNDKIALTEKPKRKVYEISF